MIAVIRRCKTRVGFDVIVPHWDELRLIIVVLSDGVHTAGINDHNLAIGFPWLKVNAAVRINRVCAMLPYKRGFDAAVDRGCQDRVGQGRGIRQPYRVSQSMCASGRTTAPAFCMHETEREDRADR